MSEDPMLAAVARARAAENAFAEQADDEPAGKLLGLRKLRAELAATVATTPAGLAALTGFVREMTAELEDFYFEGEEAVMFASSLDTAVRGIFGLDQDVT
jgi:hypothetical protein